MLKKQADFLGNGASVADHRRKIIFEGVIVNWVFDNKTLRGAIRRSLPLSSFFIAIIFVYQEEYFWFAFLIVTAFMLLKHFILGFVDTVGLSTEGLWRVAIEELLDGTRFLWLSFAAIASLILLIEIKDPTKGQTSIAQNWGLSAPMLLKEACRQRSICTKYKEVRLSCAEAGSISKCIEIKMAGDDFGNCSDTGTSALAEEVRPSYLQCLTHNDYLFAPLSKK